MSRPVNWVLIANGDGTHDLQRGGRTVLADVPLVRAESYIRTRRGPADRISMQERDGYLTVHTLPAARKK